MGEWYQVRKDKNLVEFSKTSKSQMNKMQKHILGPEASSPTHLAEILWSADFYNALPSVGAQQMFLNKWVPERINTFPGMEKKVGHITLNLF